MPLQIRRGTEAERQTLTSTNGLVTGELLYVTNTQKLYIGTGVTGDHKGIAITGYTNEDAQDAVGPMFQNGTHNGIAFVYDDVNNFVNASVNLSNYQGVITADGFVGSVFADSSTTMVDGVSGTFNLDGTVGSHIVPNSTSAYDLGSNTRKFRDLYLSGSSIHLGSATITSTGSAINLPAGSTINGTLIGSTVGDIKGSVFGDDSSVLVDGVSGKIYGHIITDLISAKSSIVTVESKLNVDQYSSSSAYGSNSITLRRSRGTIDAPEITENGDVAGSLVADARVSSGYATITGIVSRIQGVPSSTAAAGSLEFRVSDPSGNLLVPFVINSNESSTFTANLYSSTVPTVSIGQSHNDADARGVNFSRSRGTSTSPTSVQASDVISKLNFVSHDGTSSVLSAQIRGLVDPDATVSTGAVAGKINFLLSGNDGIVRSRVEIDSTKTVHYNQFWGQTSVPTGLAVNLLANSSTVSDGARLMMRRSRGTFETPSTVVTGDSLYRLGWGGHDGTAYRDTAFIVGEVSGAVSTGVIPTKLAVKTTNSTGTLLTALEVSEEQVVKVNTVESLSSGSVRFNSAITLATYATTSARDLAIPSPTPGMMVYVTGDNKFYGYAGSSWTPLN